MQFDAQVNDRGDHLPASKSPRITVSVREDEYDELTTIAEKHDISLSRIARQALSEFLERYKAGGSGTPLHLSSTKSGQDG